MIKKHKPYQGNSPPCAEASNKGDPRGMDGSKVDSSTRIDTGGNLTPLPNDSKAQLNPVS